MDPRRLLVAGALAAIAGACAGAAQARPSFGVEAGLNQSGLTYRSSSWELESKFRPAWSAGITADQPLGARLSLHTGLRYVEYGDVQSLSMSGLLEIRTHQVWRYVSVPALLRWRPLPARGFFVEAGPEAGYLANARLFSRWTETPPYVPAPQRSIDANIFEGLGTFGPYRDMTRFYRRWNVSLAGGAGYEWRVAGRRVTGELRYAEGLASVNRSSDPDRRTRGLEALVGLGW